MIVKSCLGNWLNRDSSYETLSSGFEPFPLFMHRQCLSAFQGASMPSFEKSGYLQALPWGCKHLASLLVVHISRRCWVSQPLLILHFGQTSPSFQMPSVSHLLPTSSTKLALARQPCAEILRHYLLTFVFVLPPRPSLAAEHCKLQGVTNQKWQSVGELTELTSADSTWRSSYPSFFA